ncbi:hypothetical protein GCM10018787_39390 [Streptomyces thermodiastaticus]|nr:hypothetical protein GCM10018787_39390 [Streptomyces thermodiastaticus]
MFVPWCPGTWNPRCPARAGRVVDAGRHGIRTRYARSAHNGHRGGAPGRRALARDTTGRPGAKLSGAALQGGSLRGALLVPADLSGAGLRDADLLGAGLRDADLRGADLTGAAVPHPGPGERGQGRRGHRAAPGPSRPAHWRARG